MRLKRIEDTPRVAMATFKAIPKLAYAVILLTKQYYVVIATNKITAKKLLEDHYAELFRDDKERVFDQQYFTDLTVQLDKYTEALNKNLWWLYAVLSLLFLSLFNVADKIGFYGTQIDIRYYTPLTLSAYSFCRLSVFFKQIPISIAKAILTGYARAKTSDKNVNLYVSRYGVAFSLDKDAFLAIAPKLSFSVTKRIFARFIGKYFMLTLLWIPLYCTLYVALVVDALTYSSIGWPLKLWLVSTATLAETATIVFGLWGNYAAVKDPEATRKFWIRIRRNFDDLIARGESQKAETSAVGRETQ